MTPPISTRRLNPLTGEYMLVSPLRMSRPWSQALDEISEDTLPVHDPDCYLCPGNQRSSGVTNPNYADTHFFENDFPSLSPLERIADVEKPDHPLFAEEFERGRCEVICFTPEHNMHYSKLPIEGIEKIIRIWTERFNAISDLKKIGHIQIFETRGKEVGNSSPHPHCQIWAQESIPTLPHKIYTHQQEYFQTHDNKLLLDYVENELLLKDRVITTVGDFVLLVPFWAEWPYELYIAPSVDIGSLNELTDTQVTDLAKMISITTKLYFAFFKRPEQGPPYMMSISQRPTAKSRDKSIQLFFRFITPLLTPVRQKYQAGYEKSAEPQRDITPETAAEQLRVALGEL